MKEPLFFSHHNRRSFIKGMGLVIGSVSVGLPQLALTSCNSSAKQDQQTAQGNSMDQNRKMGIALVGLGNYASGQLAPALQETENCYLAGIVTGTPSKAEEWKKKYNIPEKNVYNYENFDQISENPDIDIVYVVLPNSMHAEYTIRAARAGKHVISEKPMATTVEDCQRMINACNENNVKLSIGYRLHFEPHNQRVMELGQNKIYGPVRSMEAAHSFRIGGDPNAWRLDQELSGGGPLMDVGIYCVQGAIYTVGTPPTAVTAKFGEVTRPDYFDEVEQSISWQMEFPNGAVANCSTSYNDSANLLYGEAENGWWRLQPAYSYSGIDGETSEGGDMNLPQVNQQARQMDDFAMRIRQNEESPVSGEMGLRDVKILLAIYEAARTGKRISI